ncbi:MAG: hypothetical protein Q9171_002685 [Xanthocarpia ochracea]
MDAEQFRRAGHSAVDEIVDYMTSLESRRVVSNVSPGYLRSLLPSKPPDEGEDWEDIQKDIETKIMPGLTHCTSASGGGGVIQGSASEAILTVMIAAREQYLRRHCRLATKDKLSRTASEVEEEYGEWRLRTRLVALGSEMSHSSTQKAAMVAGVNYESIPVDVTDQFALTGRGLMKTLQDLTRRGWEPFYLTVTLGTTSTCAVDHFKEIAEVKRQYPNLWVHVDAAYAGAALLLEEYQGLTDGFEAFDSFDVNVHKWLLTNFDASSSGLVTDYRDWQIPLGRRFRALKIWFVLRSYGVKGMKDHIKRHIELGERFASWVKDEGSDLFELVAPPSFALTVLRVRLPEQDSKNNTAYLDTGTGGTTETKINEDLARDDVLPMPNQGKNSADVDVQERVNALTKEVYESINATGDIFLTATMIKDVYAIRVVSANEQTDEEHLRKAFEILVKTTEDMLRAFKGKAESR